MIGSYHVPCLGLANENEGIGRDDGEAEVDEDDGTLGTDVPGERDIDRERNKGGSGFKVTPPCPPSLPCDDVQVTSGKSVNNRITSLTP